MFAITISPSNNYIFFTSTSFQSNKKILFIKGKKDEFNIEWRNLLLEQGSLAEHSAIESKAKRLLDMKRPNANSEVIVTLE